MIYTPHDYQQVFLGDYLYWIDNVAQPGDMRLYTAPTGTGKSVMELMALEADPYALLVTPRLEIVAGMLAKMGVEGVDQWSTERLAREALARRITTPVRLRNMLAKGECPHHPHRLIFDEGHHVLADTYKDIKAYLPAATWVVLTATGFRGTPKETDAFLALFGNEVNQVLSLRQAAERGLFTTPTPKVWPLIDDDTLEVQNGEIRVNSATEAVRSVLGDVVERCEHFTRVAAIVEEPQTGEIGELRTWDRPTMFAVPSTAAAYALHTALLEAELPSEVVVQDTPRNERSDTFRRTVAREVALIQIDVVSEGVDLPIRRLLDLRPTLSPVRWLQQLGRITRPTHGEPPSEYICTNRNLERHGYLLDGLLPPAAMRIAQEAFGRPSQRSGARVVGLEGIGKFQGTHLPLLGGLTGLMYNLTTLDGYKRRDFVVLCHPCSSTPIIASRENDSSGEQMAWGKFTREERLPDLSGFASAQAKKLTDRQSAWWKREAARFGLDPMADVNKRNFGALPVLKDLGIQLVSG